VDRTKSLVEVAGQVVKLRQEGERVAQNQEEQGVVLVSERRQATAASYKAQADWLQAAWGICSPGRNRSKRSNERRGFRQPGAQSDAARASSWR
jgi:hypothetical protein